MLCQPFNFILSNTNVPPKMCRRLYKEFLAEREEILLHKWLESEKAGYDIGLEQALLDWVQKYRFSWRSARDNRLFLC